MPTSIWSCIYLVVSQGCILESLSDSTTESFISCLRSFIGCSGKLSLICDKSRNVQGTTIFRVTVYLKFCLTFLFISVDFLPERAVSTVVG